VGGQHGAVDEVRLLLGEQALEPEQQRELAPPLERGLLGAGIELGQRRVERASARRSGGEGLGGGLAFVYESLAREQSRRARSRQYSEVGWKHPFAAVGSRRRGVASRCCAPPTPRRSRGGANRIVLHAQTYARRLYERHGYQPRGREFTEAGIEHVAMEKVLSYGAAAPGELAEPLYERFCDTADAVRGVFGANMQVELVNDGPVTLLLETR
jgi:hypothetical protein